MILVHALARPSLVYISAEPWMALPSNSQPRHPGIGRSERCYWPSSQCPGADYRSPAWKALRWRESMRRVGLSGIHNGSKLVEISTIGQNLRFTPTRNGGSTGPDRGYRDLPEGIIEASLTIDTRAWLKGYRGMARCA